MKIKLSKIEQNNGQLQGLPKNPRFIRDERYEALKKSLTDDPEMTELRELVVYPLPDSKKYIVIGGNMRLRAMIELGWKEADAIVLKTETPLAKLREYAQIDNFHPGRFDWGLLANEWEETELKEDGLEFAWENTLELDERLFAEDEKKAGEDGNNTSLRVIMPEGTEQDTEDKVREIVKETIKQWPGVKIV